MYNFQQMKYFFLLGICLTGVWTAAARHIIGGSMTYNYLANNNYSIRLEILRDCAGAGADFDNPASIGIFDKDGNLIREILAVHSAVESISTDTDIVCMFPPNVCVERTYYTFSVTLPFIDGGYTIAYQRCCRSHQIVNLENPGDNGMTFHMQIDVDQINSSPLFVEDVPYAVFVNTPFLYEA